MKAEANHVPRHPSLALSALIFVASVFLVALVRLYWFRGEIVMLASGLPLLVCLWQRDKRLLWTMAAAFQAVTVLESALVVPAIGGFPYLQLAMQAINLLVIGSAVHVAIEVRNRLELKNEELRAVALFPEENPNPVLRLQEKGEVLYANLAAQQLLRESGWRQGAPAPDPIRKMARQALNRGERLEVDYACCGDRTFSFTGMPVTPGGYVNLYGRDVSHERQAAAALRESEEMFRGTFENAAVGVSHLDAEGRLLRANQYLQDLLDYTSKDLAATGFLALTLPEYRDVEWRQYNELVRGERDSYSIEKPYVHKDGSLRWVLVTRSAQRDAQGRFLYSINIVQDISQRKTAEETLRRYQLLANNTRDIVLFMRLDNGHILEANTAAQQAYGYTREELLGMTIYDLRDDPSLHLTTEQMEEAYEKGLLFETFHRRKDGTSFPVEVSSRGAEVEGAQTLISVVRDVTERKRAEEALRRSQEEALARAAELNEVARELTRSNQDLERFAYVVSHDLQEPLRQIVGFADLFSRRYGQQVEGEARDFLEFISEGGKRMQDLIRDLLAFSRVGRATMARGPTQMEEVVDSALFNLQLSVQQSGATVTRDPLPELNVDRGQFVQVFQNLVGNSLKFRGADAPVIHIGCRKLEAEWQFWVEDNGIGFASEKATNLFQPFQRLHSARTYQGTGIGLAICKRIVELHGGRIWAESQPNKGATFYFTVPDTR